MDQATRVHRQAVALGDLLDALGQGRQVKVARQRQSHVLHHRQGLEQGEVLKHHPDAQGPGLGGVGHGDRLALPDDLALVRADDPVDHLH